MKELNFKEWLRDHNCLEVFARNRLMDDDWEGYEAPDLDDPRGWVGMSFYGERAADPDHDKLYWANLHFEWSVAVGKFLQCYPYGRVVPGMPLNDRLGMSLFVAGLEADYGKDSV